MIPKKLVGYFKKWIGLIIEFLQVMDYTYSKMARTSTVLSFDIGTVNMAVCLAKVCHPNKDIKIREWKLINIDIGNIERTSALLIAIMTRMFATTIKNDKNTWVIVERQIPTNYNCFSLSYVVWTYFMTKYSDIHVSFVGAHTKPISTTGKKRKRDSVVTVKDILQSNGEQHWYAWLTNQPKKDDLTDAYLQIVGILDKIEYVDIASEVIELD